MVVGAVSGLDVGELRELVADTLDVEPSALGDDVLLIEELGVDSVVALELAVTLEQRLQVKIGEEELGSVRCFSDLVGLLSGKLEG